MTASPFFMAIGWGCVLSDAVIPAKAGIHVALGEKRQWIPAFAGMTALWISGELRGVCTTTTERLDWIRAPACIVANVFNPTMDLELSPLMFASA